MTEAAVPATIDRTGVEEYRKSTDAAAICKEIVTNTAVQIQGRKYVRVEGWQAIALAHGCIAQSKDVVEEPNGIRATGLVIRMSDGMVLSQAEGFVGKDEPTWYGGETTDKYGNKKTLPKRADYAIRAMAQTRAISRACRSAFAHVVVMIGAGLSTTPAEEVPDEGFGGQSELTAEEAKAIFGGEEVPQKEKGEAANPYQGIITKIDQQTGKSKNGPWTLFILRFADGFQVGTFDKKMAEYAHKKMTEKLSVSIAWQPTGKGNREIVEIT